MEVMPRFRNENSLLCMKLKFVSLCRYMVRPTVGVVPSGASVNIRIYMVPQAQYTDDLRSCKDRFLIQSIPIRQAKEVESANVFNGQGRQDFRLRVIVVSVSQLLARAACVTA